MTSETILSRDASFKDGCCIPRREHVDTANGQDTTMSDPTSLPEMDAYCELER